MCRQAVSGLPSPALPENLAETGLLPMERWRVAIPRGPAAHYGYGTPASRRQRLGPSSALQRGCGRAFIAVDWIRDRFTPTMRDSDVSPRCSWALSSTEVVLRAIRQ
jgi:hypothetical protein